jgi:hypothetical protein
MPVPRTVAAVRLTIVLARRKTSAAAQHMSSLLKGHRGDTTTEA